MQYNKSILNIILKHFLKDEPINNSYINFRECDLDFLINERLLLPFSELITHKIIHIHNKHNEIINDLRNKEITKIIISENFLYELSNLNIPIIINKGAATAHLLYSDHHLRSYNDIDLIINPELIDIFVDSLIKNKIALKKDIFYYKNWHTFHIYINFNNTRLLLDVHTSLTPPYRFNTKTDTLFKNTVILDDLPVQILKPEYHLLSLICHASSHQFNLPLINWIDILLNANYKNLDWDIIVNTSEKWNLKKALLITLFLCQKILQRNIYHPFKDTTGNINLLHKLIECYRHINSKIEFQILRTLIFLIANEENNQIKNIKLIFKKIPSVFNLSPSSF
jgi:hypothetical protein